MAHQPQASSGQVARIAIVGDLHGHWDQGDAHYFQGAHYDLLLFTGDLGSGSRNNGVRIARSLARLEQPALVMLGNNDAHVAAQISAELAHQRGLYALLRLGNREAAAVGNVHLGGYSLHTYQLGGQLVTVLAARPYATGGGEFAIPDELARGYGVHSLADSARKLCELVDRVESDELLVLAHNGPTGLGARATDLWGRDFSPEEGDWGDPDLAQAISYAKARKKRVLAVIAGHMHTITVDGRARTWQRTVEGTLYINASRVPRIFEQASGRYRHHVALELAAGELTAREVLVREAD